MAAWVGALRVTVLALVCLASVPEETPSGAAARLQDSARVPARSVRDGTYTFQQARRGEERYAVFCAVCHGSDMLGDGGEIPALVDTRFAKKWDRHTLEELFTLIKETMPVDRPGTLSNQVSSDLLAYILEGNGFPTGVMELSDEPDELGLIVFDGADPGRR
jgi:mono/diheme cytochrome c family protein